MRRLAVGLGMLGAVGAARGVAASPGPADAGVAAAIARRLDATTGLVIDGVNLEVPVLRPIYAPRAHAPLWPRDRALPVLQALRQAPTHGLDAGLYHLQAIERRLETPADEVLAERDLLVSDAVMRFAVHLYSGLVVPGRWSTEVALPPRPADPVALLLATSLATDPQAYLAALAPPAPAYHRLRETLSRYQEIVRRGGWPAIPDGPSLHPGMRDPAVVLVRRRLRASDELPPSEPVDSPVYDAGLVAAVKAFQERHGLVADGVIGRGTRAALGVSAADRLAQIVANLERWRWMPEDFGERYVRVNIPAYWLEVIEAGRRTLEMPVVVGRPDRRTPLLSSRITQLTFNPSWTIPVRLAREDMLPRARRNPGYFRAKGIKVYGSWRDDAGVVDPETIDWASVGGGIGGLKLRQPPGPTNPLGRVKFHMPNGFDVYLHDTNAKGLMGQPHRARSSGCVRLGEALKLADLLLRDWAPERRAGLTRSWQTRSVPLAEPVPVYLVYETVWTDTRGEVHFREDVYGRDAALVRAMETAARHGGARSRT